MICLLCLCVERDERLLDIASVESRQNNVASVLRTHFVFCFQVMHFLNKIHSKCN